MYGQFYVDLCICFCVETQLCNLHLIALPIHKHHTGLNTYKLINKKFSDAACARSIHCTIDRWSLKLSLHIRHDSRYVHDTCVRMVLLGTVPKYSIARCKRTPTYLLLEPGM
jgi:hypothetical protein